MALSLVKRVLSLINEMERVPLDEILLHKYSGFRRLQKEGYVDIFNEKDKFFARLTEKGLKQLES